MSLYVYGVIRSIYDTCTSTSVRVGGSVFPSAVLERVSMAHWQFLLFIHLASRTCIESYVVLLPAQTPWFYDLMLRCRDDSKSGVQAAIDDVLLEEGP